MKLTKQELDDYLKQIKKLLVCDGARRKEFMNSFEDNLEEYLKANPDTDFSKLQEEMGTPQEIANSFLENESAASIKKRMSVAKWVIIGIAVALLLLIITFVCNPWPILLHLFLYRVTVGHVRSVSSLALLCRKRHGACHR